MGSNERMGDTVTQSLTDYLAGQRGRAAALARALKVKPTQIGKWARGERPVPPKRAVQIEHFTAGLVPRRVLRSDWAEHWPELVPLDAGMTPDLFAPAQPAIAVARP